MEENKLKPCPFCGKEDIRAKIVNHDGYDVGIVFCTNCGAQIKAFSEEEAVKIWNKRVDDEIAMSIVKFFKRRWPDGRKQNGPGC